MLKYLAVFLTLLMGVDESDQDQKVELWNFDQLSAYMRSVDSSPKIKVINFWATWCAPCIKEMPYFDELNTNHKNNVEVLFVSLDFSGDLEKKVVPLLKRMDISSKVVIMTDGNYNDWIDRVDSSWTGALPATLFVEADGENLFYEKSFEKEELFALVEKIKQKK